MNKKNYVENIFSLNCSVSIWNLYMRGNYLFIVIANDKPSNKLCNILKLRNKTLLEKKYLFLCISACKIFLLLFRLHLHHLKFKVKYYKTRRK